MEDTYYISFRELCEILKWSKKRKTTEFTSLLGRYPSVKVERGRRNSILVDIRTLPIKEYGIPFSFLLSNPDKFLTLSQYSRKYKVRHVTVSRWLKVGLLKGIKVFRRVLIYDEPVGEGVVREVEFWLRNYCGGKPVALVRLPRRFTYKKFIIPLGRSGNLFLHLPTGAYYYLIDYKGGEGIRERFPSPSLIVFPPSDESKVNSWGEFSRVSDGTETQKTTNQR